MADKKAKAKKEAAPVDNHQEQKAYYAESAETRAKIHVKRRKKAGV